MVVTVEPGTALFFLETKQVEFIVDSLDAVSDVGLFKAETEMIIIGYSIRWELCTLSLRVSGKIKGR